MSKPFYVLSRSDEQYRQVKDRFNRKWSRSDGPPPRIENIFHVDEAEFRASHRGQRWNARKEWTAVGLSERCVWYLWDNQPFVQSQSVSSWIVWKGDLYDAFFIQSRHVFSNTRHRMWPQSDVSV
ncbi:hypothetical protein NXS19_000246 [Fusarium pseudograminearum]|nr:hypothetical protein NXS19_000246 [Fusarium pseudograminearum]